MERSDLVESADSITLRGIAASTGLACGLSFIHYEKPGRVKKEKIDSSKVNLEIKRLEKAISKSRTEIIALRKEALSSVGRDLSQVLDAQLMILEDSHFMDKVKQTVIARLQNVEYVYQQEVNKTIRALDKSKDVYIREMISDINAVTARLLHNLSGIEDIKQRRYSAPVIAFAPFFTPAEIMNMRKSNVVGFVAESGGPTSHMALFAGALAIPAVVGVEGCLVKVKARQKVCLDGGKGSVIISPSINEWRSFKKRIDSLKRQEKKRFVALGDIPSETRDGRKVQVTANLEIPTEYDAQLSGENVGVGLYRTEFLYLSSTKFPDEEQQFETYKKIAQQFSPQPVTLRTFDLGGDKFTEHFEDDGEANPALGWRAIRFSLDVPRIFRTQLRAMLRASAFGNIRIMFPMISSVEQIVRAKRILASAKIELARHKVPFDNKVPVGIMIEIPSAVIMAHRLALEVDFFSIGTNDLTQYTLAVDRGNSKVAKWYREHHPAVLRLIDEAVRAGHECNIPVALCGEIAGDPKATRMLVGFGIDALSTNPGSIRAVKDIISQIDYKDAQAFSRRILSLQGAGDVEKMLSDDYRSICRKK